MYGRLRVLCMFNRHTRSREVSVMSGNQEGQQAVSAANLTVPQLQQHKQMLEQELSYMTDTVAKLKAAQQAYDMSGKVLGELTADKKGKEVLVPLTNSVFVSGHVGDCSNVLLNVGTGYFVEKPVASAKVHCEDKSRMLGNNISNFAKLLSQKRDNLEICMHVIQQKLATSSPQQ